MNHIGGRVKENGVGIPDLRVVIYDADIGMHARCLAPNRRIQIDGATANIVLPSGT